MNIDGFMEVEFYDFEAYFAGDVSSSYIEALYEKTGEPPTDLFSGGQSVRYDSVNDVTIVSGRSNMPPFEEGMQVNIHCVSAVPSDIFLYA